MTTPSPLPTRQLHTTLLERAVALGAVVLSCVTGALFASLMPWPHAGLVFAALWGAVMSAMACSLVAMRLHDRMRHTIKTLDKRLAQTPRASLIPSYTVTPEEAPPVPPAPVIAPVVPVTHHTPVPRRSFHTLDELSGETLVDPVVISEQEITLEERQMPTEPLAGFADPPTPPPADDPEQTLNEVARPTQNLEVPGAVLMSMAELDAEMTPVADDLTRKVSHATRPFSTPVPMFSEPVSPRTDAEATVEAPSKQHFDNRATMPLDAGVVQSIISDQRSTQKIEDIPAFMSQSLARRAHSEDQ